MKCIHVNAKKVLFILLTVITNNIYTAENQINSAKEDSGKEPNNGGDIKESRADLTLSCPADKECANLPADCISCPKLTDYPSCIYGEETTVDCQVLFPVKSKCLGPTSFQRTLICRYCYQTDPWEHSCDLKASCNSVLDHYTTNCTVKNDILCYGHRMFNKKLRCNWTGGYKWFTALALSVTLGGFGADRFYLGHWQEAIGKLFSFGGLGVWTLIDVILISLHYLGPADGSLYL